MENKEYLRVAADMVTEQAFENPGIGIPVDPDVAEFMGAFVETALAPSDLDATPEVDHE